MRKVAGVFRKVEAEVLADRILAALEELLHERLVDDGDVLRRLVVGGGEEPSFQGHGTEVLQVVRADAIPRRAGAVAGARQRMPLDEHPLAPVVGQRVIEREAGPLDARQRH